MTLDDDAVTVGVALAPQWRGPHRADGLGSALLEAFTQAAAARFAAWAEQPGEPDDEPDRDDPAPQYRPSRPGPQAVSTLLRAWRDLDEFRIRLHEIHNTAATTTSPDREVVVQVRSGSIVAVHVDRAWSRASPDSAIERHAGHALSAALAMIADAPQRALEGCPDLSAVLAAEPSAMPFLIAAPDLDTTVRWQPGSSAERPAAPDPDLDW